MSRLLQYIDLSPSWPWLFAAIHANRSPLAEQGIDFGPISTWICDLLPSHRRFWSGISEDSVIPSYLNYDLCDVAMRLDAGRDVLLMSRISDRDAHQSLNRLLKRKLDLSTHEIHTVFVVGRPSLILEQCYREVSESCPVSDGESLLTRCKELSLLLQDTLREWGESNVSMLADLSASPVTAPDESLMRELFAALGCPASTALCTPDHLPRYPLVFASYITRRLCLTPEVRENAWPPLDIGMLVDCLRAAEQGWGTEVISPLKSRQRLIHEGEADLRTLEALLTLKSGALDCPDWLASQAEASQSLVYQEPLPTEKVATFAAALPSSVRESLRQRFNNDRHLLTQDQQALATAIDAVGNARPLSAGTSFITIGEPIPPTRLSVLTMTYNHEKHIAGCMDSVLAQKTDFPVRHIVLDHHSMDGTPAIISAYAERHPSIRPVLLSQHRAHENVMGLFLRCRTEYVALCDGDDYFVDPLKLQKQVDFLEKHPHCALCFHPVAVLFENGERSDFIYPPPSGLPRGVRKEYYLADLLQCNMIQTNSVVYRWRFREGLPAWFRPNLCPGDWYWHLLHAETGKIGFLNEVMAVYRRHKKAMYANAFISSQNHRRTHGMAELATLRAVNEHFNNRYFARLANLANGIFADFFDIYLNDKDSKLLDNACIKYPEFAHIFLNALKPMRTNK